MTNQHSLFDQRPFVPEPEDYARWSGQKRAIFDLLKDLQWHTRQELVTTSGAKNPTSRVSDLRKLGYQIDCDRTGERGKSSFKMIGYVGYDTTKPKHCATCTCRGDRS